jgi:hypothetical protein
MPFGDDRIRIVTHEWKVRNAVGAGEPAERSPGSEAALGAAFGEVVGAATGALLWGIGVGSNLSPDFAAVVGGTLLGSLTAVDGSGGGLIGRSVRENDARFWRRRDPLRPALGAARRGLFRNPDPCTAAPRLGRQGAEQAGAGARTRA